MDKKSFKLDYDGSLFWLIFWLIIFFPIAFVLLLTAARWELNGNEYKIKYGGSRFWLCFWVLLFFPVAFLLLFLNGVSVTIQKIGSDENVNRTQAPTTVIDHKDIDKDIDRDIDKREKN